jgi:hypothetical protein
MAIEETMYSTLGSLFDGRVYPDIGPNDVALPYAVWTQVGGSTVDLVNNSDPILRNSRIQLNIWATTRLQANQLMRSAEAALRTHPVNGRPVGALMARLDPTEQLRGAQQDYSIWWT